mmetsp:Transcript_71650/g.133957  ORF Transcript_71650/g.133957 Transcript_71650/m.133957 type:complete len:267 (-) Transcript_71650:57-857(-)
MGNAQARQQAALRAAGGGPLTAALGVGPLPGGTAPAASPTEGAAEADAGAEDKIPVVFTWAHGGQHVSLAGGFGKGWQDPIPMVRSGNEFVVVQDVPRGLHQYKFIVDDQWRCAPDQPKAPDGDGNTNNILDITNYQRFQAGPLDEADPHPKFGQTIPDLTEYTLDAPAVPAVLYKSTLCAAPMRFRQGTNPPSVPLHSLCDHVYIRERADGEAPCSVVTLAVTHRYGQKYSTTIFATRCPFDDGSSAAEGENLLKKCLLKGVKGG